MAFELTSTTGWVSEDGSWGVSPIITFHVNDLTEEQWETLSELNDNDKFDYAYAIMAGEPLDKWEVN